MGTVSFEVPGPGTYQVQCDPSLAPLANAGTAGDVLAGKRFYNDQRQAVTGTIATKGASDVTADGPTVAVPPGYYPQAVNKTVSDPDLVPGNIKAGVDIFGVTGTFAGGLPDNVRTITLTADPPEGGTVSGGGVAQDGMTVTVSKESADGYQFDSWEENGQSVSESPEYTFTVSMDRELAAKFVASRLPKGYTELQYINWVGANNTFVTLDSIHGQTDRIVLKFYPTSYETGDYNENFLYYYTSANNRYIAFRSVSASTIKYHIVSATVDSIEIQNQNTLLTIDVNFYEDSYTINGIALSGGRYSGTIGNTARAIGNSTGRNAPSVSGRFYSLLQYRNGSLIHEYVACQDSSGVCGIFDINTSTFIQNTHPNKTDITPGPAV